MVRAGEVLLSRLAPYLSEAELWTLPGGGLDFGEHPADAVVREVREETGLDCTVGAPRWIGSARRVVDREAQPTDLHSVRLVYDAWVAADAPEPRVVEVDGSTVDARWWPVAEVVAGVVPTVPMVREALAWWQPTRRQRLAVKALVLRGDEVLLVRNSVHGPRPGRWSLPGGGVEHGESPLDALHRELAEETGLTGEVERLLGTLDEHFTGTAPDGREEDFHGVEVVYAVAVGPGEPRVVADDRTSDAVAWHPLLAAVDGTLEVAPLVPAAVALLPRR